MTQVYDTRESAVEAAIDLAHHHGKTQTIWLCGPGRYLVDTYRLGDERQDTYRCRVTPQSVVLDV